VFVLRFCVCRKGERQTRRIHSFCLFAPGAPGRLNNLCTCSFTFRRVAGNKHAMRHEVPNDSPCSQTLHIKPPLIKHVIINEDEEEGGDEVAAKTSSTVESCIPVFINEPIFCDFPQQSNLSVNSVSHIFHMSRACLIISMIVRIARSKQKHGCRYSSSIGWRHGRSDLESYFFHSTRRDETRRKETSLQTDTSQKVSVPTEWLCLIVRPRYPWNNIIVPWIR
jgi:hypothetical protein